MDPPSTPVRRLRSLRDPAKAYQLQEFTSLVNSFFTAVRGYLILDDDPNVLTSLESRVHEAMGIFERDLILEPASQRPMFAINVLSHALRGVSFDWVKKHRLFYSRLQMDALIAGVKRLDNLVVAENKKKVSPVAMPPRVQQKLPVQKVPLEAVAAAPPYCTAALLSSSPAQIAPPSRVGRYAVGAILSSVAIGLASGNEQPSSPATVTSTSSSAVREPPPPTDPELYFFRHTTPIIDPIKPHTSVVVPTLEAAFSRYPTRLAGCYSERNTLNVHSASELAHYIADHPDQRAHSLIQRVSRRRGDRTITIWWTENCHEMVIAPGVQTSFQNYINPRPVTIRFIPRRAIRS